MTGAKSGVAERIQDEEPRAVYPHCYGHSINVASCDAIKQSRPIKCALETAHEIIKRIKYSPRLQVIFQQLKHASDVTTDSHSPGIRVLCPSAWMVHAHSLASILKIMSYFNPLGKRPQKL